MMMVSIADSGEGRARHNIEIGPISCGDFLDRVNDLFSSSLSNHATARALLMALHSRCNECGTSTTAASTA